MKKTGMIIMIIVAVIMLCAGCGDKYDDYYRFSKDEIYIENHEVKSGPEFTNKYYIIENDNDLTLARNDYLHFDELPGIGRILEEYPLDKNTYFIEMMCMGNDEVALKAILIDKETNRIYTDSDYKRGDKKYPTNVARFWVSYAVIEKDKLQGFDFLEQKEELYGSVSQSPDEDR